MKHSFTFLFGIITLTFITPDLQAQENGDWELLAPMPTPRQEIPHAALDGKIYVPGGLLPISGLTDIVEVYDVANDTWETIAPMPASLHHAAAAACNGKVYVIGGYSGGFDQDERFVFEYDPEVGEWTDKAFMNTPRGAHMAVEFEGKIYVFGGVSSNFPTNSAAVYDPVSDSWSDIAPMPTAREHLAAAAIDSLIYVVGGRHPGIQGFVNNNELEAYAPASDTWYTLTPMPTARGGLAAAAVNGKLYVFGGEIPGVFDENQMYDPATDTWRDVEPLPTARHGMGAATVDGAIYVLGGGLIAGRDPTNASEAYRPIVTDVREIDARKPEIVIENITPNPAFAATFVQMHLPQPAYGKLAIIDVSGSEVITLRNGPLPAGRREINFDATPLTAGLYFCVLTVDGVVTASRAFVKMR